MPAIRLKVITPRRAIKNYQLSGLINLGYVVLDLDRVHAVRVLRGLAALLLWLVATLLLVVGIILSITVVLLPIGLLLGFLALRLYRLGLGLVLPRKRDVARGVRKEVKRQVDRWRKRSHAMGLDRPVTTARKNTRTVGKTSRKALRRISR